MQNISIFIRGAIGIKKGLGLDEIEFDFKDKDGLIALAGPNGRGKTTLLELMSPYRTMASRKGALKHHFFLRDSRVERKFVYNGDEYHLIWKIDSGSDRSESFIIVNSDSVVNGKNTEYDKYVNKVFGSQNLFYNSVFCAQGSGNLSTMTQGKIKELFVEFLRIERLAEYEKECKKGVAYCQKQLDKVSGKIEACNLELEKFHGLEGDIKKINTIIREAEGARVSFSDEVKTNVEKINGLKYKAEKQKTEIERKAEITEELKKLHADQVEIKEKIDAELQAYTKKKSVIYNEVVEVDTTLQDKEKILNAASRIDNLEKWEKYFSECFECAMDEQAKLDRKSKKIDAAREDFEKQLKALNDDPVLDGLKTMVAFFNSSREAIDRDKEALRTEFKALCNDFSLMQASQAVADCREKVSMAIDPDCTSTTCPAINMVASAKEELPALEKTEADVKDRISKKEKEIAVSLDNIEAETIEIDERLTLCEDQYVIHLEKINTEIAGYRAEIEACEKNGKKFVSDYITVDEFKSFYKFKLQETRDLIAELKELAGKTTDVTIAEDKKARLEEQFKQLEDDFESRKQELDKNHSDILKNIYIKQEVVADINKAIDLEIENEIKDAEINQAASEKLKAETEARLEKLREKAAVLKSNLERKDQLTDSLIFGKESEAGIKKELQEWEYLRLACSKTGLQALEIDGAAPLITAEANTLLEKAFGLESQIKIITQDPETGKEVFWIKVIREDGVEDDFSNLSGGQKVWISEALSKGMTLVSKKKSGKNFEALYSDESDGALDSEKAIDFMKMKRAVMDEGGFVQHFFVSHNQDVVGMADHVIDFGAL